MTLTLTLRTEPPAQVLADPLLPERLRGLAVSEIGALEIRCGRERLALADLFDVSGTADEGLVLAGDLGRFDEIGARMSDGTIDVRGDVGDWAGAEMSGGIVRIFGDAGARLGAARAGARAGMTGGEILVFADAGEEAGAGMRRGLVAIGGEAGSGAGLRMLAGTVIALGGIGAEAGLGNKRGSLVSGRPVELLPVYAFATRFRPPTLRLQLRRVRDLGLPVREEFIDGTWSRWAGDRTELGRGEILIFEKGEDA